MAEPFLSEIRMMAFTYPPQGWAFCNGQLLPISQNQALFSLLGTTYGGDGQITFALPDLRGRTPMHRGPNHTIGEVGGEVSHTLTSGEVPGQHTHTAFGAPENAGTFISNGRSLAVAANLYRVPGDQPTSLAPATVTGTGGQTHPNLQPYLPVNFCIALQGVFPSRN